MVVMLKRALQYASSGFPVFPCCWPDYNGDCACGRGHTDRDIGKVPLVKNGLTDATIEKARIINNWKRWPQANIAIAIPPGYFVLDMDIARNGFKSLGKLQDNISELPETLKITTGSGGAHLWYKTDQLIRNTTRVAGYEGLDIRGLGGYVIAPPSLHRCGLPYEVSPIWSGPIMLAPAPLIELCLKKQPAPVPQTGEITIPFGQRNDRLFRLASAMRRQGASEDTIYEAVKKCYENDCEQEPALDEKELRRIALQGAKYQPAPPEYGFRGGVVL